MYCSRKKQLQLSRVLFLLSGFIVCTLYQLTISARLYKPLLMPQIGEDFGKGSSLFTATHKLEPTDQTMPLMHEVHHTDTTSDFKASIPNESPPSPTTNCTIVHGTYVAQPPQETPTPAPGPPLTTITPASPGEASHIKGEYPADLFPTEDSGQGWVILHIIGMIYMFISLAVVCDEFFVPALGVITDKLAISDDVAGATFMAAGRSIPKLFARFLGIYTNHITVGIGSIVGSAVFNMLFVIGMCALFSRKVLQLTWWPLFRDVSFYTVGLILLIIFFLDNVIMWWESMLLVTCYTLYVIFMKFNVQIEHAFKTLLHKHKCIVIAVEEPEKDDTASDEKEQGASEDPESGEDDSSKDNNDSCQNEDDETKERAKEDNEKKDKPLSLEWPDTRCKQATYLFLLPVTFPLWLTLPDVHNQKYRKLFVVTFLCSIMWIAIFSYFMVWWAHQVGETIGIPGGVMTILAAGASSPDLITSVIVARKGLGDMAVSSSVGTNIFDITVGLPVPWLLYSIVHGLAPVAVSSNGLFCVIVLLVIMLLSVTISIASCKWKMNKALGFTMLLLYFIYLVLCMLLKYRIIVCPVSI